MAKIKKHLNTGVNKLCESCLHDCKQSEGIDIVNCKKYTPQLEMRFKKKKKPSKS